jgi:hypothetical protein
MTTNRLSRDTVRSPRTETVSLKIALPAIAALSVLGWTATVAAGLGLLRLTGL